MLSAAGMVTTDFKYDQLQSFLHPLDEVRGETLSELDAVFEEMITDGIAVIDDQNEYVTEVAARLSVDLRYREQAYEVTVPLETEPPIDRDVLNRAETRFHDRHEQLYGHSSESDPVEIVNVLVDIVGFRPVPDALSVESTDETDPGSLDDALAEVRPIVFDDGEYETQVYERTGLESGHELAGPFVIEEPQGTTVVPPGQQAHVDRIGNVVIEEGSK
ncbi:hypothetical protein ACFQMM_22860 [Saliphagus sp. GCM10025308]